MLLYLTTVAAGVLISLFVHELGHLLAARWYGARVLSISIGIGPEIIGFSDRWGTCWKLAALPVGASLAMLDKGPSSTTVGRRAGPSGGFSDTALRERIAICLAGPIFNLFLALSLLGGTYMSSGQDGLLVVANDSVVFTIGGLSLFIGAFNLLPLLPLDGGLIVFLGIEAFRATPVPAHIQSLFSRAGFLLCVLSTLLLIMHLG